MLRQWGRAAARAVAQAAVETSSTAPTTTAHAFRSITYAMGPASTAHAGHSAVAVAVVVPPRMLHSSTAAHHGGGKPGPDDPSISVTFVEADGVTETTVKAAIGTSLLEVAHAYDIELEGACEGSLACSTCHVIVQDQAMYNKLTEPDDDENDMLDLAFGLTETSRLGCQIIAADELDGLRVALPPATRNFAVDGFKPKPH